MTQFHTDEYIDFLSKVTPDNMEQYEKDKKALIEKAAASGGLDIVETEDGELIAVDKDGSFYSTADSTTRTLDSCLKSRGTKEIWAAVMSTGTGTSHLMTRSRLF